MRDIARIITIVGILSGFAASAGLLSPANLRAQGPQNPLPAAATPREGVLLLKNGQVLAGRITWSGDHYFVDRGGLQMGVRAGEVLGAATDMDDAYRQQRAAAEKTGFEGHQELAQWCMRHGLLGYAANELAQCEALHPGNPRTATLMRQLQSAVRTEDAQRESQAAQAKSSTAGLPTPDAATGENPADATSERTTGETGKSPDAEPEVALSNDALEMFVTTIQPMLINQCATGGCHGGMTATTMKLQRFDPRRTPGRVYTERNLRAVLKQIDRDNPNASPLLVAPSQPHGNAKTPIFAGRTLAQHAELAAWVRSAVGGTAASPAVQRNGQQAKSGANGTSKSPVAHARHDEAIGDDWRTPTGDGNINAASNAPVGNPHDPDVFNRRFFPEGRPDTPHEVAADAAKMPIDEGDAKESPPEPPPEPRPVRQPRVGAPRRPAPKRSSPIEDEIPPFESLEER